MNHLIQDLKRLLVLDNLLFKHSQNATDDALEMRGGDFILAVTRVGA